MKYLALLPFAYLLLFVFRFEKALTQDLGRHIVMGREIVECFCVPAVNLFSYTQPEHVFINHHWFSEVLFYYLYSFGGMVGLFLFKLVFLGLAFLIVFRISYAISRYWAILLSFPFLYVFSYRFDIRPELISFLCLSLFLTVLYKFRQNCNHRLLLVLCVLQIVWVNSHIYFFIGPLLYVFFAIEQVWLRRSHISGKKLFGIGVLLFGALFVNPNHVYGALYPFTIFNNYGYSIYENQGVLFLNSYATDIRTLVFEILALGFILGSFVLVKKDLFVFLSGVFAVFVPFVMIRNLPIFVLVLLPALVIVLKTLERRVQAKNNTQFLRTILACLVFGAVLLHVIQMMRAPESQYLLHYVESGRGAADFFQKAKLKGPLFNNFDIGSYLIFRLYPDERVFVDGRPEAYSENFFLNYKTMQEDVDFFEERAKFYGFEAIIFSVTDITPWAQTFYSFIFNHPDWVVVYRDQWYVVLVRKEGENAQRAAEYLKQLSPYAQEYFIRPLGN